MPIKISCNFFSFIFLNYFLYCNFHTHLSTFSAILRINLCTKKTPVLILDLFKFKNKTNVNHEQPCTIYVNIEQMNFFTKLICVEILIYNFHHVLDTTENCVCANTAPFF